ncbi:hypothetical protein FRB96_000115 [Tulasnella sp. 330]|nr:hypothetical protein FRB96_000115 [Tulasnella sp. 330]KAG8891016.1 hypothetical protein FRB98_000025 [Tulasnella sp. 332]
MAQGAMRRHVKSQRKKAERKTRADERKLHGERAKFFYYQCQQLILRLQIHALVKLWKLPAEEFEILCRDIWALHLSLLPTPPHLVPPDDPKKESKDKEVEPDFVDESFIEPDPPAGAEAKYDAEDGSDKSASDGDISSGVDEEAPPKPRLDPDPALVKLLQEVSDSESTRSRSSSSSRSSSHALGKAVWRRRFASPAANIAVLVVACWTFRVPVIYMDFIWLIESYELPYLNPLKLLSPTLLPPLTAVLEQAIEPRHPPNIVVLHEITSRLAKLMHVDVGITAPEMNAAPIFWRAVHVFKGSGMYDATWGRVYMIALNRHIKATRSFSAVLYSMTKALAAILELPLTLHRILAPKPVVQNHRYKAVKSQRGDHAPPELSVIATVVLAIKLVYGLDGRSRRPQTEDDPASCFPEPDAFFAMLRDYLEVTRKGPDSLLSAGSQRSVADMSDAEIDVYLGFCEKALLPKESLEENDSGFQSVARFFPVGKDHASQESIISQSSHSSVSPKLPAMPLYTPVSGRASSGNDEPPLLPGQDHTVFHSQDILGYLPQEYELVLEVAGDWVGVGKESVAILVERFERRLGRWVDQQRHVQRQGAKKKQFNAT